MVDAKLRVLIVAGGTGGHVFPGLAVANGLRECEVDVQWVGTESGIEARVVPASQFRLHVIRAMGLRGKQMAQRLQAIPRLIVSVWKAFVIIKKLNPHCVLGMGGFVSGPVGIVAVLMRKPLLLQEQNTCPGTTNKLLLPFSRYAFVGFPDVFKGSRYQSKVVYTGNPLRKEIYEVPSLLDRKVKASPHKRRFLVLGGSQGAHALNEVVPRAVALWRDHGIELDVWHQTGIEDRQLISDTYKQFGINARVSAFIEDMAEAYTWADLAIARSGALTVSELVAVGLPAVLVPYPHAIDDHQFHNAQWMVDAGAAKLLLQSSLTVESLLETLNDWLTDDGVLESAAASARGVGKRDATQIIVQRCKEVAYG